MELCFIHLVLGTFKEGSSANLVFNLLCVLFHIFSPAPPHLSGLYMTFHYDHRSKETIKASFEGGCFCSCHLIQHAVLLHSSPLSDSLIMIALSFYSAGFPASERMSLLKEGCVLQYTTMTVHCHFCDLPCHYQVRKPKIILLLALSLIQFKVHG